MTMKPKSEPETISSSLLMSLRREFRLKLHQETGPWDVHLPLVGMALRAGVNCTTGFSPNLMMLGREVLSPLELVTGVGSENLQEPAQFVRDG